MTRRVDEDDETIKMYLEYNSFSVRLLKIEDLCIKNKKYGKSRLWQNFAISKYDSSSSKVVYG